MSDLTDEIDRVIKAIEKYTGEALEHGDAFRPTVYINPPNGLEKAMKNAHEECVKHHTERIKR